MASVLLVDDEAAMLQLTTEVLRADGHDVFPCGRLGPAHELLEQKPVDLVITDLCLEGDRPVGLELLARARARNPPPVVIVITGLGSVETAVEAMRGGAFDYLTKPFNLDQFRLSVQRALSYNTAVAENAFLRRQLDQRYHLDRIVGTSPGMQAVFRLIERAADSEATVLVRGESGTGKELVARALHFNSRRRNGPFVPINCAALPETLLESELFGHRRGAFTGAVVDKKGLLAEADGGTIFLDEIGAMPAPLQSRLLRFLQDREVRRVGDTVPSHVNVRVVAATNEDLEKRLRDGGFREDLYYRLNVIPLLLPPLRDRREDVPLLATQFLRGRLHPRSGAAFQISREALTVLTGYDWPGNVRELQNALERAMALSERELVDLTDLPPAVLRAAGLDPNRLPAPALPLPPAVAPGPAPAPGPGVTPGREWREPASASLPTAWAGPLRPLKEFVREQEVAYLQRALALAGGDKERAATLLGISLATFYRRLAVEE